LRPDTRDSATLRMTKAEVFVALVYTLLFILAFRYVAQHQWLPSGVLTLISLPSFVLIWTRHWTRRMGFGWFRGYLWPQSRDRDAQRHLDPKEFKKWTVDDWQTYYEARELETAKENRRIL
jgi:hypothetical protein